MAGVDEFEPRNAIAWPQDWLVVTLTRVSVALPVNRKNDRSWLLLVLAVQLLVKVTSVKVKLVPVFAEPLGSYEKPEEPLLEIVEFETVSPLKLLTAEAIRRPAPELLLIVESAMAISVTTMLSALKAIPSPAFPVTVSPLKVT